MQGESVNRGKIPSMFHTAVAMPSERSSCELRQRIVEGLAHRYTLRTCAVGRKFVSQGVENPRRLPAVEDDVGTGIREARNSGPLFDTTAAIQLVLERVELELRVIERAGLVGYLLLMADCARYGRSLGAACVARGSAPGSLVNYLLGISNVDPIRLGLHFERFLNSERLVSPRVHLEFPDNRLAEMIEWVRNRSDSYTVAHLVTDLSTDTDPNSHLPILGLFALKSLSVIQKTCDLVMQAKGDSVLMDDAPLNDTKTFKLLCFGELSGIFPLDCGEAIELCRELQPTCIGDLTALVVLHRPDLGDLITDFIKRRRGQKEITYPHPLLEPVVRETYGLLIYQKQLMQAVDLPAGDIARACDRLVPVSLPDEVRGDPWAPRKRCQCACPTNSLPAAPANQLFNRLEQSSRQFFNKSHATGYPSVACQTAYQKASHPAKFSLGVSGSTSITFVASIFSYPSTASIEQSPAQKRRMSRRTWMALRF